MVSNKRLDIALLFIILIYRLTHLHIHEFSLILIFLAKIHQKLGNIAVFEFSIFKLL